MVEPEHAPTLSGSASYTRTVIRRLGLALAVLVVLSPLAAGAQEGFELQVDGFGFAVNMAFAPDGTIFVADKDVGEIRIVRDGEILDRPFATLPIQVTVNETGLLGVAVHPEFPDEPWVYAYFTGTDAVNHLVRIRADGDRGTESSRSSTCCRPPPAGTTAATSRSGPTASSTSRSATATTGRARRTRTGSAAGSCD